MSMKGICLLLLHTTTRPEMFSVFDRVFRQYLQIETVLEIE